MNRWVVGLMCLGGFALSACGDKEAATPGGAEVAQELPEGISLRGIEVAPSRLPTAVRLRVTGGEGEHAPGELLDAPWAASVTPPMEGTWSWESSTELAFTPRGPFEYGETYTFALTGAPAELQPDASAQVLMPEFEVKGITPTGLDKRGRNARYKIHLSGQAKPSQVLEQLEISQDGTVLPVRLVGAERASDAVEFEVARLAPSDEESVTVTLGSFAASSQPSVVSEPYQGTLRWSREISEIEIHSIHLVEGTKSWSVEVICSDYSNGQEDQWMWVDSVSESFEATPRCALDPASLNGSIRTVPPLVNPEIIETRGGFRVVGDFSYGPLEVILEPGATTLDGGILTERVTETLNIGRFSPSVRILSKGRYLQQSGGSRLPVQVRNIGGELEVEVRHVPLANLTQWLRRDGNRVNDTDGDLVKRDVQTVESVADEYATVPVDLSELIDPKTPGVYEVRVESEGRRDYVQLVSTDLAIVAKAESGSESMPRMHVWAMSLQTSEPQAGVTIEGLRRSGTTITSCVTNRSGWCSLDFGSLTGEDALNNERQGPFVIVAKSGDQYTYLSPSEVSLALGEYEVSGAPGDKVYRAALYGDRDLYRPGETAHLSMVVRDPEGISPEAGMPVTLSGTDPRGRPLPMQTLKVNAAGMASTDVNFPLTGEIGPYRFVARVAGKQVGNINVSVEEFVPERMAATASPVAPTFSIGDPLNFEVSARYLFGGSAEDSLVEMRCNLRPEPFTAESFPDYGFGMSGDSKTITLTPEVKSTLDADGKQTLSCPPIPAGREVLSPMKVRADVSVFESGSGRSTKAKATAVLHPSDRYLGLRVAGEKLEARQEQMLEGVLVDLDGEIVADGGEVQLTVHRVEREYNYMYDTTRGYSRWMEQRRTRVDQQVTAELQQGRFSLGLRPTEDAHGFLITAEYGDQTTRIEVDGGWGGWYWRADGGDRTPKADRPEVLTLTVPEAVDVGEDFTVSFEAPFDGRALLTLEKDGVLHHQWKSVKAGPVQWEETVDSLRSNVYASVLLLAAKEGAGPFVPQRAFGVQSIRVRQASRVQALEISTPDEVRTTEPLKVNLSLGSSSEPRFVTVSVVDQGVLSLTDYELPDPMDSLVPKERLGVRTFETLGWTLSQLDVGPTSRHGGGLMGRAFSESTTVELVSTEGDGMRFKPVALFQGPVAVPESGEVTVSFDIPEYQGEVRVMVVAASPTKVAHGESAVLVRDPLVMQATLPRYLHSSDVIDVPVFVTNLAESAQEVKLSLTAEGLGMTSDPVVFQGQQSGVVKLEVGESATRVFRVQVAAETGAIRFTATAESPSLTTSQTDVVPVAYPGLEVTRRSHLAFDSPSWSAADAWSDYIPGTVDARLWVTASPFTQSFAALGGLLRYPHGCIEQTTSMTRPLLFSRDLLGGVDPNLAQAAEIDEKVQAGISRVLSMQVGNGGFSYWPGGRSPNAWGTAYAVHMLLDAKNLGFPVPEQALNGALDWLESSGVRRQSGRAYARYVLSLAGRYDNARAQKELSKLQKETGEQFDEQRFLLQAALYEGGDRTYADELLRRDDMATTAERNEWWGYYSPLRRQGLMLSVQSQLFGAKNPVVLKRAQKVSEALSNLLGERRYTTQEISWGVTGLGQVIAAGEETLGEMSVTREGKTVSPDYSSPKGARGWTLQGFRGGEEVLLKADGQPEGYIVLTTRGVLANTAVVPSAEGLSLTRRYYDADQRPVDLNDVRLADLVYVELTLTNLTTRDLTNLAMVDRVPAGFEIENPNLKGAGLPDWVGSRRKYAQVDTGSEDTGRAEPEDGAQWRMDYQSVKDDSFNAFGSLARGQTVTVVYPARAVTSGDYWLPPATLEAMYLPDIRANTRAGEVQISGSWDDERL